ncbi:uncharacterized protein C8orf34 homolog isoform X2 [Littorina saxatilis]|uniref:uncharacterized protein C8orf34 homolog isoform X2 n=1 Tax=Littorina saxatilis TaxID=31220 RepID=UPI0038B49BB3
MSQATMEAYMDRHKLGPLFEDLMNRVLHDMPEEPLIYLLRSLYKKAGMEIPQDIRYGGLRKSVDIARSRSPERASRGLARSEPLSASPTREYQKPWLTQQRRMKPRRSMEDPETIGAKTAKKRPDWHGDTKVGATSFDELWEDHDKHARDSSPGKKSRLRSDPRSSWASVGLGGGDTFTSGEYRGPSHRPKLDEEQLLAAERVRVPKEKEEQSSKPAVQVPTVPGVSAQRIVSERHRQELETILHSDNKKTSSGPVTRPEDDVEDEALELLENAEDLEKEGVKNVPMAGYKLSKIMRQRSNEPCVKLNINPITHKDSLQSMEGYESDEENPSPTPGRRWESEDEFESVSQVTGPRVPVWQVPDSDGETGIQRSASSKRNRRHQHGRQDLTASAPGPFQQVTFGGASDLELAPNQSWSPGLNVHRAEESSPEPDRETYMMSGRSRGWEVPDDSDAASVQDWNQRVKGRKRDLRSY